MSVKIRLALIGKRNAPSFKIVASTTRNKRNGKFLDILGHYNPSHNPVLFELDKQKLEDWKNKGAQVSSAVEKLADETYEFAPYTRQNEAKKEKAGESNAAPQESAESVEVDEQQSEEATANGEQAAEEQVEQPGEPAETPETQ